MSTHKLHHLGLAIRDLDTTTAFFTEVLGFKVVRERPDYPARFVSNGETLLTLWQTEPGASEFNRRTSVGLHHFALGVESREDLDSLHRAAADFEGVKIEFAPEPLGDSGAFHTMMTEPGGIRIELIWAG